MTLNDVTMRALMKAIDKRFDMSGDGYVRISADYEKLVSGKICLKTKWCSSNGLADIEATEKFVSELNKAIKLVKVINGIDFDFIDMYVEADADRYKELVEYWTIFVKAAIGE